MKEFIKRFSSLVKGTISGFDRIVFKGLILPLMSSREVMSFCRSKGILNKDYKEWMMRQTAGLIENAEHCAQNACGHGVEHISSWRIRKEELAHKRQQTEQIEKGLVGVWSVLRAVHRIGLCTARRPDIHNCRTIKHAASICTFILTMKNSVS